MGRRSWRVQVHVVFSIFHSPQIIYHKPKRAGLSNDTKRYGINHSLGVRGAIETAKTNRTFETRSSEARKERRAAGTLNKREGRRSK